MRSLPKLIPGVHPKLPDGAQDEVKAIYKHAEEHREEFNCTSRAKTRTSSNLSPTSHDEVGEASSRRKRMSNGQIKVAYWPGCVSRGFTTELHGSMAFVADKLDMSWSNWTAPPAAAPA